MVGEILDMLLYKKKLCEKDVRADSVTKIKAFMIEGSDNEHVIKILKECNEQTVFDLLVAALVMNGYEVVTDVRSPLLSKELLDELEQKGVIFKKDVVEGSLKIKVSLKKLLELVDTAKIEGD